MFQELHTTLMYLCNQKPGIYTRDDNKGRGGKKKKKLIHRGINMVTIYNYK